jgi:hypothetical protein
MAKYNNLNNLISYQKILEQIEIGELRQEFSSFSTFDKYFV